MRRSNLDKNTYKANVSAYGLPRRLFSSFQKKISPRKDKMRNKEGLNILSPCILMVYLSDYPWIRF